MRKGLSKSCNSSVFKILTLNSYGLKILQTLFAEPAPGAPSQGEGGRGVPRTSTDFPKPNGPETVFFVPSFDFFFATFAQAKVSPHA